MAQRSGQAGAGAVAGDAGGGGADGLGQGRGHESPIARAAASRNACEGFRDTCLSRPCIRILPRHDEPVRHRSARPQASRAADRSAVGRGDVGDHAGGNSLRPSGGPGRMDYSDLGNQHGDPAGRAALCDAALGSRQAIAGRHSSRSGGIDRHRRAPDGGGLWRPVRRARIPADAHSRSFRPGAARRHHHLYDDRRLQSLAGRHHRHDPQDPRARARTGRGQGGTAGDRTHHAAPAAQPPFPVQFAQRRL